MMLKMEFKKSYHSKVCLYLLLMTTIGYLLGYILPIGIDKVSFLTYEEYLFSTYTVFTQFGFLMFSFGAAYYISKEYKEKTIIFYDTFKINCTKFYFIKIMVMAVESSAFLAIGIICVSFIYGKWMYSLTLFLLFCAVVIQYLFIVGGLALIFDNILVSLGLSIACWIFSVALVAVGGFGKYLAVFDASNELYLVVENFLAGKLPVIPCRWIILIIIYLLVVVCVCGLMTVVMNKRWKKLGL